MKSLFIILFLMLSFSVSALEMGSDDFYIYDSNKLVAKIEKKKFKEIIDTFKYVQQLNYVEGKGWIRVRFVRTDDPWIIKGVAYNFRLELTWFDMWEKVDIKKMIIYLNKMEKEDEEDTKTKVKLWPTAQ